MKPRPAAGFLAGAASRLLPMSVPFRFFGAAVVFHFLAWLALLAGADRFPRFGGGLGWPLAALHLVTLGVLMMSALGASLQLLPVATRQPVGRPGWPLLIWWLYTPGVALLTLGMGAALPALLGLGALAVAAALALWALLLASNLRRTRRAGGMNAVVAHGWAALAALVVMLASALALVGFHLGWPLAGRTAPLALHVVFAAYGTMGLLGWGMSYILVPMFALAVAPDEHPALASGALAVAALALAALAAFGIAPQALRLAAIAFGSAAAALHLHLMRQALRSGIRQQLGRSMTLVRLGWVGLGASLVAALAMVLDAPGAGWPGLFVLLLVGGWLLTFLLGILQRILPFLAATHASRGRRRAPTASALSAARPLAVHFACHLTALGGLALAIAEDSAAIAALAAAIGAAGALAFGGFFWLVLQRTRHQAPAAIQAPVGQEQGTPP
ncbi:MAG: hypothetical protein KGL43_02280 [Burkholderiales bacterium]|nr:hypothetical protein [Burkholderiales bacterium]